MFFFYLLVLIFYVTINFYLGRKIFLFIKHITRTINPFFIAIPYAIAALPTMLSFLISEFSESAFKRLLMAWSNYFMGIFIYLLLFSLLTDFVVLIVRLIRRRKSSEKAIFISTSVILILTVTLYGYGLYNIRQLKTVSYELKIEKSTDIGSLNIVMISDLHLGYIYTETQLAERVERINSLEPDIVFIVGDIFDGNFSALKDPDKIAKQFDRIQAKYGVYACLGNHDAGNTFNQMTELLDSTNINLLNDEFVTVDNSFVIIGRRDSSPIGEHGTGRLDINYDLINSNLPVIVLDHQPSNYPEYPNSVDLMLSGHTHRGQIFPFNIATALYHIQDYGYYQKDSKSPYMIVTSGAGTWGPPLRSGSNCEIVNIKLIFAQ